MRDPNELEVFRLAEALVLDVYEVTAKFPTEERYGLTTQIRRAAVSGSSNLVEGCSRESQTEFCRFVEIALGSAMELAHQLSLARKLHLYRFQDDQQLVEERAARVCKMLNGLGKALRAKTQHPGPRTPSDG